MGSQTSTLTAADPSPEVGSVLLTLSGSIAYANGEAAGAIETQIISAVRSGATMVSQALAAGANTINAPHNTLGYLIIPAAENTRSITHLGVSIHQTAPFLFAGVSDLNSISLTWGGPVWYKEAVTLDNATDVLTKVAHGLSVGDRVRFHGTLPPEMTTDQWYYVTVVPTVDTFQINDISTGALDFSTNGTSVTFDVSNYVGVLFF